VDSSGRRILAAARGVLGELDLETVLDRVMHAARDLTGAQYAALGVLEQSEGAGKDGFARFIVVGMDERTQGELGSLPRGLGVLGELIRDAVPLRVANVSAHPHSYGFPSGHPPMRTFLGVPVFVGGRAFANLYLTEKAGGKQFTPEDEEAVVTLADLAGVAIENARRYTGAHERHVELERSVAALEATTQVTRAIGDETDVDVILELVAKRGRALVSARVLLIELSQGDELLIAAGAGEVPAELVGKRVALAGTFAEQAVRARSGIRVEDEVSRARFNEVGVGRLGVHATAGLVVPLLFRERSYGALLVIDRLRDGPAFSTEDAVLLEAFAASAATAVAVAHTVAADVERLAAVVRSSTDAIVTIDEHRVITSWNPGAERHYGYTADETVGVEASVIAGLVVPADISDEMDILPRVLGGEIVKHYETSRVRKDGTRVELSMSVAATRDRFGKVTGIASVARDVTEQKRTQRILAQTERLESIGQLAGGVAHDMNNLLTIILNHTDFALESIVDEDPAGREIHEVRGAAERAATLIRQLLLFARSETTGPETIDLNEIAAGAAGMLTRALGERITLETELVEEPRSIQADRGQVEQVIVNLAVNARDAMPDGGTITITTANVTLTRQQLDALTGDGGPGEHVRLDVHDTGTGMSAEVVAKALDPFYTTKPAGAGTGLGLATVYGVLTKTGGLLRIASKPGLGTTIETYWPVAQAAQETTPAPPPDVQQIPHASGGEAILLVEDEQALRTLVTRILRQHGYAVTVARHPAEAQDIARDRSARIDLLLTDVVMPEVTGTELAAQLCAIRPDLRVLYTSGYVPNASELPAGAAFLAKPFSREQLLAAIATALHGQHAATA
jgi:two-component system cell cycle sensor histidine kinase/response regulator CckA